MYRQTSNIRRTLLRNKIVDDSDLVGASIACRRYSNYIFILDLTPGFNGLGKGKYTTMWEEFKFWDFVRLLLKVSR